MEQNTHTAHRLRFPFQTGTGWEPPCLLFASLEEKEGPPLCTGGKAPSCTHETDSTALSSLHLPQDFLHMRLSHTHHHHYHLSCTTTTLLPACNMAGTPPPPFPKPSLPFSNMAMVGIGITVACGVVVVAFRPGWRHGLPERG